MTTTTTTKKTMFKASTVKILKNNLILICLCKISSWWSFIQLKTTYEHGTRLYQEKIKERKITTKVENHIFIYISILDRGNHKKKQRSTKKNAFQTNLLNNKLELFSFYAPQKRYFGIDQKVYLSSVPFCIGGQFFFWENHHLGRQLWVNNEQQKPETQNLRSVVFQGFSVGDARNQNLKSDLSSGRLFYLESAILGCPWWQTTGI